MDPEAKSLALFNILVHFPDLSRYEGPGTHVACMKFTMMVPAGHSQTVSQNISFFPLVVSIWYFVTVMEKKINKVREERLHRKGIGQTDSEFSMEPEGSQSATTLSTEQRILGDSGQ